MRNLSLSLLVLGTVLPAQVQTIVSPLSANGVEGSQGNGFPFTNNLPKRYSQIHSDVGGSAKVISKIAGRMNGTTTSFAGTRVLDIEVFMGDSVPYDACSFVIPNNYIGPRVQVLPRQVVNMGPFASGTPAAFDFAIPLATPYFYTGANSLLWEMVQYANSASGTAPSSTDTENSSVTLSVVSTTGTGCTVVGQTLPMIHVPQGGDAGGVFAFGLYVDRAPANAPTVLYLGISNPNLTITGLCSPIYTDLLVGIPLGNTDANGFLGSLSGTTKLAGGPAAFMAPNTFGGGLLYSQVHSLDVTSTSLIPIANSDGKSFTVPVPNQTKVTKVTRVYSNDSQTAVNAHFFNSTAVGYGAVMQFTY